MTATIPAGAEHLDLHDVLKTKRAPSKFAPKVMALHPVLVCPSCEQDHPAVIGVTAHCACGLSIHYGLGGVDVWRADEVVKNDCQGERV